jgi:hypothetical protein
MRQSGVFDDLPAIFAGDLAENRLQVEQGMLIGFWTSEGRTDLLMELLQAHQPAAQGELSGSSQIGCGIVRRLHTFLAFDAAHNRAGFGASRVSHRSEKSMTFFDPRRIPGKSPGKFLRKNPRKIPGKWLCLKVPL